MIAVGTKARSVVLPEVPTVAEAGLPGFAAVAWAALLVPTGTPATIVQKLNTELNSMLAKPAIKEKLISLGAEPVLTNPEQTAAFIKSELEIWAGAVKSSGARVD